MIIWGTRGKNVHIADGEFFCPRCNADQEFSHFQVRNYFTLYFIPLFPLGSGGEFLECSGCGQTWSPDILEYDPEAEREENATAVRRLTVLFLLDVGRCTSTTLNELHQVLQETFDIEIESLDLSCH